MSKLEPMQELADLIEAARKLGPMTDEQRREQAASFAFGQIALTSEWVDKSAPELEELREMCRRMAGCTDERRCEHCGCWTNAKLRMCCFAGYRADGGRRPDLPGRSR